MKILLRSAHDQSVRGEDSFELVTTLLKMGVEVFLDPTEVEPPLPSIVASLMTRPYPDRFDMILHMVPPSMAGDSRDFGNAGDVNVLWTGHNSTMFNKRMAPTLGVYDAILAYDEVTYGALSQCMERDPRPMGILAPGFNAEPWKLARRNWAEGPFIFAMVLNGEGRENPELAIEAFHRLKTTYPEDMRDVQLIVKTRPFDDLNVKLMEHVTGLTIFKKQWSKEMFKTFYKDVHVLVSPDRGGLRNKEIMEFLSTGGTAIATDWSTNRAWLNGAWAYPLKYDLMIASHKDVRNKYADPQGFDLEEQMLLAVQNRDAARRKGQLAADMIPSMFNWNKVLESLFLMTGELTGESVYEKFQRCQPIQEEVSPWKS